MGEHTGALSEPPTPHPLKTRVIRLAQNRFRPLHWGLASRLPMPYRRHYLFAVRHNRIGNFTAPVGFNEKVNARIVHDRTPEIVQLCDKMGMKDVAAERAGDLPLRIPRTIWHGVDLGEAPDLDSVGPWVLKPNHSSGQVLLGPGPSREEIETAVATWTQVGPGQLLGEWGYTQARHELLLEERIGDPADGPPADFKFYVFDGTVRMIQVNEARRGAQETATFLDADWKPLPARWRSIPAGTPARPQHLDLMVRLAGQLAEGWDFMRVDFYYVDGEIWFGEFSPYPGGGMLRFLPQSFETWLGQWWDFRVPGLRVTRS